MAPRSARATQDSLDIPLLPRISDEELRSTFGGSPPVAESFTLELAPIAMETEPPTVKETPAMSKPQRVRKRPAEAEFYEEGGEEHEGLGGAAAFEADEDWELPSLEETQVDDEELDASEGSEYEAENTPDNRQTRKRHRGGKARVRQTTASSTSGGGSTKKRAKRDRKKQAKRSPAETEALLDTAVAVLLPEMSDVEMKDRVKKAAARAGATAADLQLLEAALQPRQVDGHTLVDGEGNLRKLATEIYETPMAKTFALQGTVPVQSLPQDASHPVMTAVIMDYGVSLEHFLSSPPGKGVFNQSGILRDVPYLCRTAHNLLRAQPVAPVLFGKSTLTSDVKLLVSAANDPAGKHNPKSEADLQCRDAVLNFVVNQTGIGLLGILSRPAEKSINVGLSSKAATAGGRTIPFLVHSVPLQLHIMGSRAVLTVNTCHPSFKGLLPDRDASFLNALMVLNSLSSGTGITDQQLSEAKQLLREWLEEQPVAAKSEQEVQHYVENLPHELREGARAAAAKKKAEGADFTSQLRAAQGHTMLVLGEGLYNTATIPAALLPVTARGMEAVQQGTGWYNTATIPAALLAKAEERAAVTGNNVAATARGMEAVQQGTGMYNTATIPAALLAKAEEQAAVTGNNVAVTARGMQLAEQQLGWYNPAFKAKKALRVAEEEMQLAWLELRRQFQALEMEGRKLHAAAGTHLQRAATMDATLATEVIALAMREAQQSAAMALLLRQQSTAAALLIQQHQTETTALLERQPPPSDVERLTLLQQQCAVVNQLRQLTVTALTQQRYLWR